MAVFLRSKKSKHGGMMVTQRNDAPVESTDETIHEICALLANVDDPALIYDFFGCLFTRAELKDFSNRWNLVKELESGTTQREIAKKYGMSLCNITRGSRELKKEDSAFKKILSLLHTKSTYPDA